MIGKTISHYRVLGKLGEGGMGVVYLAEDTKLKRRVALKFLPRHLTADGEALERFEREAQAAAALNHPNIVTIHEIGSFEDCTYICMEYVDGSTLREMMAAGPLPIDSAIDIAGQICGGLGKAHEAGIIHRDIKPENILVDRDGRVKILDFGLVKLRGSSRITSRESTYGTARYMSPEQARGDSVDKRTDIWSTGAVIYEMLTGRPPFQGDYEQAVIYAIINEKLRDPEDLRRDIPSELGSAVRMALEKDPGKRTQDTERLLTSLTSAGSAGAVGSRRRGRKLARPVFYSAAVVVVAAAAILFWMRGSPGGPAETPKGAAVKPAIAVLPLANLTGDESQEYFVDAMTEALITDLAKIGALKVISSTSVMHFKDAEKPLPQIAGELGVDYILTGSIVRSGQTVRISARLIDAASDQHIWADNITRQLDDILSLQAEVAKIIAGKVKVELTPGEAAGFASTENVDPEKHLLYLEGRYFLQKRTAVDNARSLENFHRLLSIDSLYAPAFVGLSLAYIQKRVFIDPGNRELLSTAKKYALRALGLDSELAEAHMALACVLVQNDWDFEQAEAEFVKAVELSPGLAEMHAEYAAFLRMTGSFDEALAESREAFELDPLSHPIGVNLAESLARAGKTEEAVDQFERMIEMAPGYWSGYYNYWGLAASAGMEKRAFELMVKMMTVTGPAFFRVNAEKVEEYEKAYADSGWQGSMEWLLGFGRELKKEAGFPAYFIAQVAALLERDEEAIDLLEESYTVRDLSIIYLVEDMPFDGLKENPGYLALVRKIGLDL